ncbi:MULTISPECIES: hypothetical protein [Streptomyces]|uniref:Uncharacterized protein n=1 Tax=Streptomyces flaveolus TaxID=67297 RepID=A0ABV3ANW0_9ACTN|nr:MULTISPECIES: hypothetical protein [Streptomyces]
MAQDEEAVAECIQLLQIVRDDEDGCAGVCAFAQRSVDLSLGADIHAGGGLVDDEDVEVRGEGFAEDDLLLVAAAERRGMGVDVARDDLDCRTRTDRSAVKASAIAGQ